MAKHVYFFGGKTADCDGKQKDLLGGKGANLAEMCKIGIPVPPGFTITTEVCAAYYDNGKKIPEDAIPQIDEAPFAVQPLQHRELLRLQAVVLQGNGVFDDGVKSIAVGHHLDDEIRPH